MTPPSKTQVAFHEAGHAVVGTLLDIPIWYVKARQEGEMFGHVRKFGASFECDTWRHLVMSVAGRESARRVTTEDVTKHAQTDLAREAVLLLTVPEDDRAGTYASVEALTASYVTTHWNWIQRVANQLLRTGYVTGPQIKALRD